MVNKFSQTSSNKILEFYLSQRPDSGGRMIDEIWLWDYHKLESVHDYIQWLFPSPEKSRFNPNAPILTTDVIQAFKADAHLRSRLLTSLKIMLKFYGLQCHENTKTGIKELGIQEIAIKITPSEEYLNRKPRWVNSRNHNFLRITRILTCLRTLGLENYALAFFQCLDKIYQEEEKIIGRETYQFWKNAVGLQ